MQRHEFHRRLTSMIGYVLGTLVCLGLGGAMLFLPGSEGTILTLGLGIFLGGIGLVCLWYLGKLIASRGRPAVVVDAEGFEDNNSAIAAGRTAWSEVEEMGLVTMNRQVMVGMRLADPEAHKAKLNAVQSALVRANQSMMKADVFVTVSGLNAPPEEIFDLMLQAAAEHHARHGEGDAHGQSHGNRPADGQGYGATHPDLQHPDQ